MKVRLDIVLRLEALIVLIVSTYAYFFVLHASWGLFLALFLVPDISLLPYAGGPRRSGKALFYNLAHTYALPLCLLAVGLSTRHRQAVSVALIWLAHIALDRALGYGLKFEQAFQPTHIQSAGVFLAQNQTQYEMADVSKM